MISAPGGLRTDSDLVWEGLKPILSRNLEVQEVTARGVRSAVGSHGDSPVLDRLSYRRMRTVHRRPGKQGQVEEMLEVYHTRLHRAAVWAEVLLQELNLAQLWEDQGTRRSRKWSWRIREGVIPLRNDWSPGRGGQVRACREIWEEEPMRQLKWDYEGSWGRVCGKLLPLNSLGWMLWVSRTSTGKKS